MNKVLFAAGVLALATVGLSAGRKPQAAAPPPNAAPAPAEYQEMLNKYCVTCHNEKARIPPVPLSCVGQGESEGARRRRGGLGKSGSQAWRRRNASAKFAHARSCAVERFPLGADHKSR